METKVTTESVLNPHTLCIEILKIYNHYEVIPNLPSIENRKLIGRDTEIIKKFPLSPINISDIKNVRKSKKSGIIYKNGTSYYYGRIPKDLSISGHLLGNHSCSHMKEDCDRLYALPEKNGGCRKVLERNPRIEIFSWITQGFQTLNCNEKQFFISKCEHFEHTGEKRKSISFKKLVQIKKDLADFYYN